MGSLERITVRGRQRLVVSWLRLAREKAARGKRRWMEREKEKSKRKKKGQESVTATTKTILGGAGNENPSKETFAFCFGTDAFPGPENH